MKRIPLTHGKYAIVDDEDYEALSRYKWHINDKGYAMRSVNRMGVTTNTRMHRVINQTPQGMDTDHINHNKLDNRRANLRTCINADNMRNRSKYKTNTSGYKGVCRSGAKWIAQITIRNKHIHLGSFTTAAAASRAYQDAAREYHKEFACS